MIRIVQTSPARLFVYAGDHLCGILNMPTGAAAKLHSALSSNQSIELLERCSAMLAAPRDEYGYCECGSGEEEEHSPECASFQNKELRASIARELARLRQREVIWND